MHVDKWENEEDEEEVHKFVLGGAKPVAKKAIESGIDDAKATSYGISVDDSDDVVMIVEGESSSSSKKRRRSEASGSDQRAKKKKPAAEDEIILIE